MLDILELAREKGMEEGMKEGLEKGKTIGGLYVSQDHAPKAEYQADTEGLY